MVADRGHSEDSRDRKSEDGDPEPLLGRTPRGKTNPRSLPPDALGRPSLDRIVGEDLLDAEFMSQVTKDRSRFDSDLEPKPLLADLE